MTTTDVLATIASGSVDDDLRRIHEAINQRHKVVRAQKAAANAAALSVGDTVIVEGISPKYLNGTDWTVQEIHGDRMVCEATEGTKLELTGRRHGDRPATFPASCLRKRGE